MLSNTCSLLIIFSVSDPGRKIFFSFIVNYCNRELRFLDDCEAEVIARSSKNGAIGQNTISSFSSSALNFLPIAHLLLRDTHTRGVMTL